MTRTRIEAVMTEMRPRLHRYCARMLGSAFDGEDVVQEALAKASQALAAGAEVAQPEAWLLRIAHNAALDALRRRARDPVDALSDEMPDTASAADSRAASSAALASFLALAPAQRAAVALVDVLGHSAGETAAILDTSVAAVKASLHRGRLRLRAIAAAPVMLDVAERARLEAYAERFNAHDWDALRALLAEDVRLDLANRTRIHGAKEVGVYFTRYESAADWQFSAGTAEGRPALLVRDPADLAGPVRYVVLLEWREGAIAAIRDFRFAPYVMEALALS
jgi:RNA polymerase sigma-70 factor, ECF subfamily